MYKIKSILKTAEKKLMEDMDSSIEVLKSQSQLGIENKDHIQTLLNGIAQKKVLAINYFANHNKEHTKRDIEPVGIFYKDNYWHLVAFCLMRNDYRDFRVNRINHVIITNIIFNTKHPTLKAYIAQTAKEKDLDLVVVLIDKAMSSFLECQKYYSGFISEKVIGDQIEMTFLTTSLEGFARWFMMFGDKAEVISPFGLKDRVNIIAASIAQNNLQLSNPC